MKFITLTNGEGLKVLINPMMIVTLQELEPTDLPLQEMVQQMPMQLNTIVYTMAGDRRHVKETVEEILELIKKSENITTVTWKTGATPHI